tara:strand:+ start:50 stop:298 length:249 start_codon:yes stop_codon:yes gene_type:complete
VVRRKKEVTKLLKRFDKFMKSGTLIKVASRVNKTMRKNYRGKKAPKGYHFMPGGKLMKDSAHKRKKRGGKKKTKTRKKKRGY